MIEGDATCRPKSLGTVVLDTARLSSLLKNALVAFFNLAKRGAKLRTARKITTCVAILSSHPCDVAACRLNQQAASALSLLDFGVDGFEFAAGVVDFHLPVDAALGGVDVG